MQTHLLIPTFIAATLLATSCVRDDDDFVVIPASDSAFAFRVDGIYDLRLTSGENAYFNLPVVYMSGGQQTVRLALSGVPSNIAATLEPEAGIPNFTSSLSIRSNINAQRGTVPLTLTATPDEGDVRTYRFNLIIQDATPCDSVLPVGIYFGGDDCTPGTIYSPSVAKDTVGNNRYVLNNFHVPGGPSVTLRLVVDCANSIFSVQSQALPGGGQIFGNGNVIDGAVGVSFSYRLSNSASYTTCNAVFTR